MITQKIQGIRAAGFFVQITLNICVMLLEYLEILNLYNCNRWYCSGVGLFVLLINIINTILFKENLEFNVPSLICHILGSGGLLFWDVEHWNISTRHRTEYYDTHDSYFMMLYVTNFFMIYRYYQINKTDN